MPTNRREFRLGEFANQESGDEFVIPEDLSELSDEDLANLHEQATANFDQMYGDGTGLSDDDVDILGRLTEGIEALSTERANRQEQDNQRAEQAQELAARVRPSSPDDEAEGSAEAGSETEELADSSEGEDTDEAAANSDSEDEDEGDPELVTASSGEQSSRRSPVRVPMSSVRSRAQRVTPKEPASASPQGIKDVMVAAGEGLGPTSGEGVDFEQAGDMLNRRIKTFNVAQYEQAQRAGRQLNERHSLLSVQRTVPDELQIRHNDPSHVNEVLERAGDEKRLPEGSLTASGGWCAPSETIYSLVGEVETRDGILSLPEIGVPRGGVSFTQGINFGDLYASVEANGIYFDEATDESGNYGGPGGSKPCIDVPCPTFQEHRLDVTGLCVTAGILESRGYPEVLSRTLRGLMVAHDHWMNAKSLNTIASQSKQVTMPAPQEGAAAPLLDAIELQVEHYKANRRMSRGTTLEAVFPYWVLGAVRHDLARRQGVEMLAVPDSRIIGWFTQLGVSPQFVYDWQGISDQSASSFTTWPTTVTFLLYAAGTWVRGVSDIITLDTVYDSQNLGENNYLALFTEEGYFVAQRGQDSRAVTVEFSSPGTVAAAQPIAWNGTAGS